MFLQLQKVKNYLRIPLTDTSDDDFLTDLMQSSQDTAENYCNRHFEINTYTEQKKIMHKIFPNEYPIISVQSITRISPNVYNSVNIPFDVANYKLFPNYLELLDWQYVTMSNRLQYVEQEESVIEISYTAGYSVIPTDLTLACIKLVALEYKESREDRIGIESQSEGAVKYTYFKKETELPLSISAVFDRYKKVKIS